MDTDFLPALAFAVLIVAQLIAVITVRSADRGAPYSHTKDLAISGAPDDRGSFSAATQTSPSA